MFCAPWGKFDWVVSGVTLQPSRLFLCGGNKWPHWQIGAEKAEIVFHRIAMRKTLKNNVNSLIRRYIHTATFPHNVPNHVGQEH